MEGEFSVEHIVSELKSAIAPNPFLAEVFLRGTDPEDTEFDLENEDDTEQNFYDEVVRKGLFDEDEDYLDQEGSFDDEDDDYEYESEADDDVF